MSNGQAWDAVVIAKSRALLEESNRYRRVTIRHDDGRKDQVGVPRAMWKQSAIGDRVVQEASQGLRRA